MAYFAAPEDTSFCAVARNWSYVDSGGAVVLMPARASGVASVWLSFRLSAARSATWICMRSGVPLGHALLGAARAGDHAF